ncbi:MAG: hypothetical protein A2312_03410 [Candidatus Staskawiczbacteria bacterium RIFOXYB2_FULL_32_9]|uniref:Uncharacterized protein n=1 Tax=Candidatus Staskawiczbacteria bacterium RIFOXYD1_FULL_32_13 TaxID=1802234 RepID=A0A1G2JPT3_9BACT|nr:MAG: hypothetical protein UR22_C0036G0005 [Parcubacteria group bacterium GW2011_GWC2_32_10]OGZ78492.1 MAG: hypothetical protein A2360_05145 [Candidatus Staskawiczbacteria bacterium RIFOXYB1_FULL_32_11]OGZ82074.1 MAG: hypothetical protein A2312_03410 [Candidatus Staskawiczbacteria bacterium RIFOXYB2_FULL_32_9]OGZ88471.1 MAG: hypothetical protein A2561_03850 [Candidatus Staskawiczbacteria bacterium RIFOXYD1_FULL_32_13]
MNQENPRSEEVQPDPEEIKRQWDDWLASELQRTGKDNPEDYLDYFYKNKAGLGFSKEQEKGVIAFLYEKINGANPQENTAEASEKKESGKKVEAPTEEEDKKVEVAPEIKKDITPLPSEERPPYGSSEEEFQKWEQTWSNWFILEMQRTGIDNPKEYKAYFKKNIQGKLKNRQTEVRNYVEDLSGKKKFAKKAREKEEQETVENPEALSQKELKKLEVRFKNLIEVLNRFCAELQGRDRDGLVPLMEGDESAKIKGATVGLGEAFESKEISSEEINQSLQKIISATDEIGNAGQERGSTREDEGSLRKVLSSLNRIEDACGGIIDSLRGMPKEEAKSMIKTVRKLKETANDGGNFVSKKVNILKRYSR